jgi:ribosomal protein S18 acetylase RimI-like enzyme
MDKSSFNIRKLKSEELHLVREIAYQTWPISYKHMISDDQIRYMLEEMYNNEALSRQNDIEKAVFFLLSNQSAKIGFASCGPSPNSFIYKLHKLYVLPVFQKSGAGSQLLNYCINFARNNGAQELLLQVNRNNSAVEFYRKHGFFLDSEKKFDIGNGFFMDDYIMKIRLNEKS